MRWRGCLSRRAFRFHGRGKPAAHPAGAGTDARRRYGLADRAGGIDRRAAQRGLAVIWRQEYSSARHAIATALLRCYRADSPQIADQIGTQATAELITAHQLWSDWLGSGRVRKFAMVAEKQ